MPTLYLRLAGVLALLVAAAGLFFSGWYVRGLKSERDALKESAGERARLDEQLESERKRADGYSQQVIDLLANTPQATNTVREIVRANPSACVRPEPVTDGLSRALASANQAISASLSNGVLPADADKAEQPDGRR